MLCKLSLLDMGTKEQQQVRDTGLSEKQELSQPISYKIVLSLEWQPTVVLRLGHCYAHESTGK